MQSLYSDLWRGVSKSAYDKIHEIHAQREEVLAAFIAKYGCEPDRFVQIECRMPDGTTEWSVRYRTDEEMAERSFRSSGL